MHSPTMRLATRSILYCAAHIFAGLIPMCGAADIKAFPTAEGFGAMTRGGRGGRVIEVTNLNPDGPGSFREACAAKGPRTVVFRLGGVIGLAKDIWVREPFITIAGQTAPGDGICLKGAGLRIATHDVIVRGLRIRVGDDPDGPAPDNRDAIGIENQETPPYNVILDHCSTSWAIDETITCWYPCHDITIQWCIASEALDRSLHSKGRHSKGILIGPDAKRVSIHHNLMAHNKQRNPLLSGDCQIEVVNNVVYNWGDHGTGIGNYEGAYAVNVLGNYYKRGANSNAYSIYINPGYLKTKAAVYLRGNLAPSRQSDMEDEWAACGAGDKSNGSVRSETPAFESSGITVQPASEAFDLVLRHAGATAPTRDPVDDRVVQSVRDGSGKAIDSQTAVGEWPAYSSGIAPPDSDHDGMPDDWETAHKLDPRNAADNNRLAPSGYTWLEEYMNSLIPRESP